MSNRKLWTPSSQNPSPNQSQNQSGGVVRNPRAEALPSSISEQDFGKAMAQLDLSGIPNHKRRAAIMDHFFRIMEEKIHDRDKAEEIRASRVLRKGLIP